MTRKQPDKSARSRKAPKRRPSKTGVVEALPSEPVVAPTVETPSAEVVAQPPEPVFDAPDAPARRPLREAIAAREGHSDTLLFRIGAERFAIDLAAVEEAIELPAVHHLPEMPEHLLGVFELRGRLVPIYSPQRVLGVRLAAREAAAVLVLRAGEKRLGLAVDDVDDVLTIDGRSVRRAPIPDNEDSVLLGVVRRGADLIALVDGESLALACLADSLTEAA
ncbi:MAG TPA: chemotaxis protein CheW [Gemmatimonadaceae bacterium]|nr:chemotaxis protein CheW [Gemmatimonadaceae bacterium]